MVIRVLVICAMLSIKYLSMQSLCKYSVHNIHVNAAHLLYIYDYFSTNFMDNLL